MCDYVKVKSEAELPKHQRSESLNSLSTGVAEVKYPAGLKIGLR